ncbi:hypothetical protein PLICRDRAFT_170336 [Plicaturopsis crispa FD-325 SS-3]|nr:hypothetical protein PLICRDRAFT_170336 [Plicaturopsis crispa FD-325 SS-3]
MHPCLETFDIIVLIFTDIARSKNPDAARTTLASLARTCHAFQEVALDLLWEEQTGMLPLLRCMPPDLLDETTRDADRPKLTLRRPICPADWQRCQRLGARVKNLRMKRLDYEMSPEVSLAMLIASPGEGILPNLRTLELPLTERTEFFCRPGPKLRELRIITRDLYYPSAIRDIAPSLLLSFPSMCPNVERFAMCASVHDLTVPLMMASAWAGLEVLALGNLVLFGDLQASARRLCNLRELDLTWSQYLKDVYSTDLSTAHKLARSVPFPRLSKLTLRIAELGERTALAICDSLLRTMDIPVLDTIHILLRTDANTSHEPTSRSVLAYLGSHSALRSVILEVAWETDEDCRDPNNVLCRTTLQPLFACRHLVKFEWACTDGFDLDDEDVATMAASWPSLQWLELSTHPGWSVRSRITFRGLAAMLQRCPDLEHLSIVVDATQVDVPAQLMAPMNRALERIYLGNSPIADAEAVATVLSRVMPRLSKVRNSWALDVFADDPGSEVLAAEYDARWGEVNKILSSAADSKVQ